MTHQRQWNRFLNQARRHYGAAYEGHEVFALHAAFPELFSPDLLYQIWFNFRVYPGAEAKLHDIPNMVVSDLLLSGLCREVGFELYEFEPALRLELRQKLEADPRFGRKRIQVLAQFLRRYVEQRPADADAPSVREVHLWTAKVALSPEGAAREIGERLASAIEGGKASEQMRLYLLLEDFAARDEAFEELLAFGEGLKEELRGNTDAEVRLPVLSLEEGETEGALLSLPVPERLKGKVRRIRAAGPVPEEQQASGAEPDEQQISEEEGLREAMERIDLNKRKQSPVLDLSRLGLTYVPEDVFALEWIEDLRLQGNQLGIVPRGVTRLPNLRRLNLSRNQLSFFMVDPMAKMSSFLPDDPEGLSRLEELNLSYNQISNFPDELTQLPVLRRLWLQHNSLTHLPDSIGDFRTLERLDLGNNQLAEIPPSIGRIESLRDLYLNDNEIKDLPEEIGNLKGLRILQVQNNHLTSLPSSFAALEGLKSNQQSSKWQRGLALEGNDFGEGWDPEREPAELLEWILGPAQQASAFPEESILFPIYDCDRRPQKEVFHQAWEEARSQEQQPRMLHTLHFGTPEDAPESWVEYVAGFLEKEEGAGGRRFRFELSRHSDPEDMRRGLLWALEQEFSYSIETPLHTLGELLQVTDRLGQPYILFHINWNSGGWQEYSSEVMQGFIEGFCTREGLSPGAPDCIFLHELVFEDENRRKAQGWLSNLGGQRLKNRILSDLSKIPGLRILPELEPVSQRDIEEWFATYGTDEKRTAEWMSRYFSDRESYPMREVEQRLLSYLGEGAL